MDEEQPPPHVLPAPHLIPLCLPTAWLCSPAMPPSSHPAAGQSHGWTDGWMDGWMDRRCSPTEPRGAGRAQAGGGHRGQQWVPPACSLARGQGQPLGCPRGGRFGDLLFLVFPPRPLPRRALSVPDGCRWVFGNADPHQALAASPARLRDATVARHSTHPGCRSREERRALLGGYPGPITPRLAPASAVAPAPRSLSGGTLLTVSFWGFYRREFSFSAQNQQL